MTSAGIAHPSCDRRPAPAREPRIAVHGPDATTGQQLVLPSEDDLTAAAGWLHRMLIFDRGEQCWMLVQATADHQSLILGDLNDTLYQPGQVNEAQRWAQGLLETEDAQTVGGHGLPGVIPLRVTEWRAATVRGQFGWVPLFNITRPCLVGVDDLNPDTGKDCPCLPAIRAAPAG